MADDVGITVTLRDQMSPALKSLTDSTKAFDKTLDGLLQQLEDCGKAQDALAKKMAGLKRELDKSSAGVKKAQEAYKKLKKEAGKGTLDDAVKEQSRLRREMEETKAAIDANAKAYKDLSREAASASSAESKRSNRAGTGGGLGGILSALGKNGLGEMAKDTALSALGALGNSALGSDGGAVFSSVLDGMVSGAAMGASIGPLGAAIGTAAGGALGLINGGVKVFTNQDEAFKAYYKDIYTAGQNRAQEGLTSGSATATQWEKDAAMFDGLLGGGGGQYISGLKELWTDSGAAYSDLTAISKVLAGGFGDSPEQMLELTGTISAAGSAIGLTVDGMTALAQTLSQMNSTGAVTQEYLDAFQDQGVDAVELLSKAMGKTRDEISEMVAGGMLNGQETVRILGQAMETEYGGTADAMNGTYSGLTAKLENTKGELEGARGEGYNQERSIGLQNEIDAYGGALGDALQGLNRVSGENKAYMENLSEQYTREALSALLLGEDTTIFSQEQQGELERLREEYLAASSAYESGDQEAGLQMESLRQQAEALATIAYESSDQYKLLYDSEKDLVGAIRDLTAAFDGWKNEYGLNQELSKGQGAVWMVNSAERVQTGLQADQDRLMAGIGGGLGDMYNSSHAYGLDRVPRSGLYYLHQDERVLTAQAAGEQSRKSGTTFQITISNNQFGADMSVETVAQTLADLLEQKLAAGVIG